MHSYVLEQAQLHAIAVEEDAHEPIKRRSGIMPSPQEYMHLGGVSACLQGTDVALQVYMVIQIADQKGSPH